MILSFKGRNPDVCGPFVTFELFVRKMIVNAYAKNSCEFEKFMLG